MTNVSAFNLYNTQIGSKLELVLIFVCVFGYSFGFHLRMRTDAVRNDVIFSTLNVVKCLKTLFLVSFFRRHYLTYIIYLVVHLLQDRSSMSG